MRGWILTTLLLTGSLTMAQRGTINSQSNAASQNQLLTGQEGAPPPAPAFSPGAPDAGDRVAGTPANANPMGGEATPGNAKPAMDPGPTITTTYPSSRPPDRR